MASLEAPGFAAGVAAIAAVAGAYYLFTGKRTSKSACPGPRGYPFLGMFARIIHVHTHTHTHTHTHCNRLA